MIHNTVHRKSYNNLYKVVHQLFLALFLGLVTSVGVAWFAAAVINISNSWYPWESVIFYYSSGDIPRWEYHHYRGKSYVQITRGIYNPLTHYDGGVIKIGPPWSGVYIKPNNAEIQSGNWYIDEAWGWPTVCMYSITERVLQPRPSVWKTISGIEFSTHALPSQRPALLPVLPIWRGLLLNATLYAIVYWLLVSSFKRLRNKTRRNCGFCTNCGYSIRELPVCPECGAEAVSK